MSTTVSVYSDLSLINCEQWNALNPKLNPFVRYEFLRALETQGCLGEHMGWFARYFVIMDDNEHPIAAAPCYIKHNSHGEFVFDWSWADAYQRYGLHYYPKLVCAAPFNPVQGPRLMIHPNQADNVTALENTLIEAMIEYSQNQGLSSIHCLFSERNIDAFQNSERFMQRIDYQYHWRNHNYQSFDDFLNNFKSRKRKKVRHERQVVNDAGFTFDVQHGNEMNEAEIRTAHQLYQTTFIDKMNTPALTEAFFHQIAQTMGDAMVVIWAKLNGKTIAGAINFKHADSLYGRYWGCFEEHHCLHFETCFYQGIEYCIQHGLSVYEPGAQGEHKIARGFLPVQTHSSHWIADERFREPIRDFTERERAAVLEYEQTLWEKSPFKDGMYRPS